MQNSNELYKNIWIRGFAPGYVVYRECFDPNKCDIEIGAIEHKVALFLTKAEADNYCNYRNKMMEKYHSDDVKLIVDYDV